MLPFYDASFLRTRRVSKTKTEEKAGISPASRVSVKQRSTDPMPDLSRPIETSAPLIPEAIARLLKKLKRKRGEGSVAAKSLIEMAESEEKPISVDGTRLALLKNAISDRRDSRYREQIVAIWIAGRADLSAPQREEVAKEIALSLDYGGWTRAQWYRQSFALGVGYGLFWALAWIISGVFCFGLGDFYGTRTEVINGGDYVVYGNTPFWIWGGLVWACLGATLLTPLVPFGVVARLARNLGQVREECARTLGCLGGTEGIPVLLRVSQNSDVLGEVGRHSLLKTLPLLTFERHYGALESDVVPNLCRLLMPICVYNSATFDRFQKTVLEAIEQIGDRRAVKAVSRLHDLYAKERSPNLTMMQETGRVLDVLQERERRETEQSTLLRGSEAPVQPETLLRSYEGAIDTPPEQLLRVANGTENGDNL